MLLVDWEKNWRAGDDFLLSALPCAFKRHTTKPGLRRVPFHGTRQSLTPQPPRNGRHTRRKKLLLCRVPKKKHTANYYFAVCQIESTRWSLTSPCATKKHTANHYFAVCQKKHTAKYGFAVCPIESTRRTIGHTATFDFPVVEPTTPSWTSSRALPRSP